MQHLRGWVFDLDGTLTVAQHDFPAIRRELGVPAEADILTFMSGLPAAEYLAMKAQLDAIELCLLFFLWLPLRDFLLCGRLV